MEKETPKKIDSGEIKKIIKIMDTFNEDEKEIFCYRYLFLYDIQEICSCLSFDEAYIMERLEQCEISLKDTNQMYWEEASHICFWNQTVNRRRTQEYTKNNVLDINFLEDGYTTKKELDLQDIVTIYRKLKKDQQNIFMMNTLFGYDFLTIAVILDLPYGYVRKQLHMSKKQLRNTNEDLWKDALQIYTLLGVSKYIWISQVSKDFEIIKNIVKENTIEEKQQEKNSMLKRWVNHIYVVALPMVYFLATCTKKKTNANQEKKGECGEEGVSHSKKIQSGVREYLHIGFEERLAMIAFTIFCLMMSMGVVYGTGYAMLRLGLIQIAEEKYDTISSTQKSELEAVETLYLPQYLPEGYSFMEQTGVLHENTRIEVVYSSNNNAIIYRQHIDEIKRFLDNENVSQNTIDVNGSQGTYIEDSQEKMIVWAENHYFYYLQTIDEEITKEELIRVAESIDTVKENINEEN